MPLRLALFVLAVSALFLPAFARNFHSRSCSGLIPNQSPSRLILHAERTSRSDLEVAGELAGLPAGTTRYLARADLLALPQVSFDVTDDANFAVLASVRGIELRVLESQVAVRSEDVLIVAVCKDFYRGYYPQSYVLAHKPVVALEINGQGPPGWPRSREGTNSPLGPFLITHAHFAPSFKILAHQDEPQIPWGVVRLEFRNEKTFYEVFAARSSQADDPAVQAGYRIAMQNCLRCHSASEESTKARYTWSALGTMAAEAPKQFAAYVKNPQSVAQYAKMPANPAYDDATLHALTAYFRAFDRRAKR
jgi:cytochrome c553